MTRSKRARTKKFMLKSIFRIKSKNPEISKEVIILAWPVIFSNISRVMMGLVDMAMVGHLGASALAATGMGAMLSWSAIAFAIGLRTGTQTLTSRRLGQKKFNKCGTALHNGLFMALIYGAPASFFGYVFADKFVPFFVGGETGQLCIDYTQVVFLSVITSSLSFIFQGFFAGIEKTKSLMKVSIFSNLINIYLNAGLIYGTEGLSSFFSSFGVGWLSNIWGWYFFPALGVKGAAIATVIASIVSFTLYFIYIFSSDIKKKYNTLSFSYDKTMMKKQFTLALPMGTQEVINSFGWAIFYKIVALIGIVELAATEIAFQVMHASFMPAIGVGQACSTLVGKYMGEKKINKAEASIVESVRFSEMIMGTVGLFFIFFPHWIAPLFTVDPEVQRLSIAGIKIIGVLQFFDAVGMTLWFALSGAGNTIYPAIIESILIWVFMLPASYYFGLVLGYGFYAPWVAVFIMIVSFAFLMAIKINKGDWKDIEV